MSEPQPQPNPESQEPTESEPIEKEKPIIFFGGSFLIPYPAPKESGQPPLPDSKLQRVKLVGIGTGNDSEKWSIKPNPDEELYDLVYPDYVIKYGSEFWPFEELHQEEIEKQRSDLETALLSTGLIKELPLGNVGYIDNEGKEYPFLTDDQITEYLSDDPNFQELIREKEQQGFGQIIIAPAFLPLTDQIDIVSQAVTTAGGTDSYKSDNWKDNSDNIKYFISYLTDGTPDPNSGFTIDQIKQNPENFACLKDGYFIALTETDNQIPKQNDQDQTINGRTRIKGGQNAKSHFDTLSSQNERSLLPQEWITMFLKDLYSKYTSKNRKVEQNTSQLLDHDTYCRFVNCMFNQTVLPFACWGPSDRRAYFSNDNSSNGGGNVVVRPAVNKQSS